MKKITVKFIHPYPPYQVGDIATFNEREASRLTDRGFAMYMGGDDKRDDDASRLRALRNSPAGKAILGPAETRHIPGPEETKTPEAPQGPASAPESQKVAKTASTPRTRSKVEGSGKKKGSKGKGGSKK